MAISAERASTLAGLPCGSGNGGIARLWLVANQSRDAGEIAANEDVLGHRFEHQTGYRRGEVGAAPNLPPVGPGVVYQVLQHEYLPIGRLWPLKLQERLVV